MSSFQEIVSNVYEENSNDIKKNIGKICSEIKRYQEKTKVYIERNYVEFLPSLMTNVLYLKEGEKLITEVEDLQQKIENETKQELLASNNEMQQLQEELQEISLELKTTYKIMQIDELFNCLEIEKNNKEYLIVIEIIKKLKKLIIDPEDKIFSKLLCYKNIKIKYHIESEMLLHNLNQFFEELVDFKETTNDNTTIVTLKISKDESKLHDIVAALFNAKYNAKKMCDFLLNKVFEPVITNLISLDFNEDCADKYVQLLLSFNTNKNLSDPPLRTNYKTVFENITVVLTCLNHLDIPISENVSVMNILSQYLKSKFFELLINECLMYAIPKSIEEMRESTLINDVIAFNNILSDLNMIDKENDKELIGFTANVGVLFRNRFTTKILHDTVDILRKDLHDMTLVCEKNVSAKLESDPFLFPKCMISKSILEIIGVMKSVIEEAVLAKEETNERLTIISSIIEQYMIEVPRHHEQMLRMIPQQSALFYNNCMYLAHWLTKSCETNIPGFQTLAQSLQSLGNEYFSIQIKAQHSHLHGFLREFDISDVVSEIGIEPQKVIRQCLRQMDLLKNVWQTILPNKFYVRQMCGLLNDFSHEVIRKIMSIEDISTSVSNELVQIIRLIEERAPRVFEDKNSVNQVKLWTKLMQLNMILEGSLIDITEQWGDGKGPLTGNFKAEEIKHLIRALFQNTERRANALALIV